MNQCNHVPLRARIRSLISAFSSTDLLIAWTGLVAIALVASMFFVTDSQQIAHRRLYYVLSALPVFVALFFRPRYWRVLSRSSVYVATTLLIVAAMVSGATTPDITSDLRYDALRYPLLALVFTFTLIVAGLRFPRFPWLVIAVVALAGTILGTMTLGEIFMTEGWDGFRSRLAFTEGYVENPNRIASLFSTVAVFGLGLALSVHARWQRALWFVTTFVAVTMVVITQSRGGLIGLSSGLITLTLLAGYWRTVLCIAAALVALVTAVELAELFSRSFFERARSVRIRIDIWQATLERIQMRLWTGEGWMTNIHVFVESPDNTYAHPHNLFLETHLRAGVAGTLTLVALVASSVNAVFRLHRDSPLATTAGAAFVAWLTSGQFSSRLFLDGVSQEFIYLFVPVAFLVIAEIRGRVPDLACSR